MVQWIEPRARPQELERAHLKILLHQHLPHQWHSHRMARLPQPLQRKRLSRLKAVVVAAVLSRMLFQRWVRRAELRLFQALTVGAGRPHQPQCPMVLPPNHPRKTLNQRQAIKVSRKRQDDKKKPRYPGGVFCWSKTIQMLSMKSLSWKNGPGLDGIS